MADAGELVEALEPFSSDRQAAEYWWREALVARAALDRLTKRSEADVERACRAFGANLSVHGWGDCPIGDVDDAAIRTAMRAALSRYLDADEPEECAPGKRHGEPASFRNSRGVPCCDHCGREVTNAPTG